MTSKGSKRSRSVGNDDKEPRYVFNRRRCLQDAVRLVCPEATSFRDLQTGAECTVEAWLDSTADFIKRDEELRRHTLNFIDLIRVGAPRTAEGVACVVRARRQPVVVPVQPMYTDMTSVE